MKSSIIKDNLCILISTPLTGRTSPRGILSIASFLEKKGYAVKIIPLAYHLDYSEDWTYEDIRSILTKELSDKTPLLIGISNHATQDYPTCVQILKICKEINDQIPTVIGGRHVTFLDQECILSSYIDIIVRGEGEWTLLEILDALKENNELKKIKGITFQKNGEIVRTPNRKPGNLNELPQLDYRLLPVQHVQKLFSYGLASRGCPYNCAFCTSQAFWENYRTFSSNRLVNEMETLDRIYQSPMHGLVDTMLYPGSKQFTELVNAIKVRNITIHPEFFFQTRIDLISEQGLKGIEDTSIKYVFVGIESFSSNVLQNMDKNLTKDQIFSACKILRKHNLNVTGQWIIGHPGETPKEAELSLKLLKNLLDDNLLQEVYPTVFVPFPGTPFFETPEKYGLEILTTDWKEWRFGVIDQPVYQLRDFSAIEIMDFYREACRIIRNANAWPSKEADDILEWYE